MQLMIYGERRPLRRYRRMTEVSILRGENILPCLIRSFRGLGKCAIVAEDVRGALYW